MISSRGYGPEESERLHRAYEATVIAIKYNIA